MDIEITPAHIAFLEERRAKALAFYASTEPFEELITDGILKTYNYMELGEPAIHWADGPMDALEVTYKLKDPKKKLSKRGTPKYKDQLNETLNEAWHCGWSLAPMLFWLEIDDLAKELGFAADKRLSEDLRAQVEAFRDMNWTAMYVPYDDTIILCRRHLSMAITGTGQCHNSTGPAWEWKDGTKLYALEGMSVPSWVIEDPDPARFLTSDLANTELRRVAFANYGWDKAVEELDLEVLDTSPDPYIGTLYKLPEALFEDNWDGEVGATLLLVKNASPERTGEYRKYGLLANPECRTAIDAQASLAGLSVQDWQRIQVIT